MEFSGICGITGLFDEIRLGRCPRKRERPGMDTNKHESCKLLKESGLWFSKEHLDSRYAGCKRLGERHFSEWEKLGDLGGVKWATDEHSVRANAGHQTEDIFMAQTFFLFEPSRYATRAPSLKLRRDKQG